VVTALLVTSAATLFESAPFILAAVVLAQMPLRWSSRMVPYLGCGCGTGPSARSLPAAAAAWMVFGPLVGGARLAAAFAVERALWRHTSCTHGDDSMLAQLAAIAPIAAIGAAVAGYAPTIFGTHPSQAAAFFGGAFAAFVMAPCGLGTVGLAAALRGTIPASAIAFLCVAGIVDLRTWMRMPHHERRHDALAYAVAAAACLLVAARGGADLVHPKIALALWPCAFGCAVFAYRYRGEQNASLRVAPAIMLAGAVLAAPPPEYHATETSLSDAFAGERIDFTGAVSQSGDATTLVRYAITCCRADAAPLVIRLAAPAPRARGWMHARGVLVQTSRGLRLRTESLQPIPPPSDPFVYR
jgi:hypothetical protein